MKKQSKILVFCLSSLTLISWDKATKELAKEHLMNKEPVSYFHNTFRLEYVENTGAAMNLGDDLSKPMSFWLLSIGPLMILSLLFIYTIKRSKELSLSKMISFALVFSGGMGNIIDRLMYDRHVTDFMNIGINNIRTGIFNVADVCVTTGVILLAVFYYKERTKQIV
jgi:signal peptidase II